MDAPVIGAETSVYGKPRTWDVFTSYRYQKSDRHYVGPNESTFTKPDGTVIQQVRIKEGSQVINWIHLLDLSVRYNVSDRDNLSLSIPYLMAERSSPITGTRDPKTGLRPILDRSVSHATGLSDIVFSYNHWMLKPSAHPKANFSLGLGIKVPTGQSAVNDVRRYLGPDGKTILFDVRAVDQSIQPGDGGLGFLLNGQAFARFGAGNFGVYGSASYLFNPREQNEVNRFSTDPITQYLSVADQYIGRAGFSVKVMDHLGFSAGMRLEGVPVHDVFGGDRGFRRPGYAWSVEPSLAWSKGSNAVTVGVPFAVYRNRTANVGDIANNNGQPGDAAFADWILMLGFGHHFN